MKDDRRFYALDGFRGICALSVVVFHMHVINAFSELSFFRNAELFVDYFFILSGFVLAHTYGKNKLANLRNFFISRTFRLFPLHLFMLCVFILIEILKLLAFKSGFVFNNEPFTGSFSMTEIIPNALLIHSWTDFTRNSSFNYPSWSISIEYYIYIIFACILAFGFKAKHAIWLIISMASFVSLYYESSILTTPAARGLSCFFAGALSYTLFSKLNSVITPKTYWMSIIETISIIAIFAMLTTDMRNHTVIASLLFCTTVIVFAFDGGLFSKILKGRIFRLLGKLSYSIYLTHAAILFLFIAVFVVAQKIFGLNIAPMIGEQRYLNTGSAALNNATVIATLLLVILASILTQKYIEITGQKIGKKLIQSGALRNRKYAPE